MSRTIAAPVAIDWLARPARTEGHGAAAFGSADNEVDFTKPALAMTVGLPRLEMPATVRHAY